MQVASTTIGPVLWAKSSFLNVFAPAASHKNHPFDPQQHSQPSNVHSDGQRSQDVDLLNDQMRGAGGEGGRVLHHALPSRLIYSSPTELSVETSVQSFLPPALVLLYLQHPD